MSGPKTILIIDDEADLQELVKIPLKAKGYRVETAVNGEEGLEKLRYIKPDLIILDMNMPKMGGIKFYEAICEGGHPKYPVFVLTARANLEEFFADFDVDGFMAKPFELEDLLSEIEMILHKKSAHQLKTTGVEEQKRVCIVDDNKENLSQISTEILGAGYLVSLARSAREAIERICTTVPDVALVNLQLQDLSGDEVILKLKKMVKTRDVKCVLYVYTAGDKEAVTDMIGKKEGVLEFVSAGHPGELLAAVERVLAPK